MPGACYVYRPPGSGVVPAVGPLPASARGHITFGTLTRAIRINDGVIRVWSEILKRVPGSRLVVDSSSYQDESVRQALVRRFESCGVEAGRLSVGYHTPGWSVLGQMDIGLDCFPHNSGTTLFESVYMGVPYVTLAGRPSVGRMGGTILKALGLDELIAQTPQEYIERAVALAADEQALQQMRQGLRARMQASELMNEPAFVSKIENAYLNMFEKWLQLSS